MGTIMGGAILPGGDTQTMLTIMGEASLPGGDTQTMRTRGSWGEFRKHNSDEFLEHYPLGHE